MHACARSVEPGHLNAIYRQDQRRPDRIDRHRRWPPGLLSLHGALQVAIAAARVPGWFYRAAGSSGDDVRSEQAEPPALVPELVVLGAVVRVGPAVDLLLALRARPPHRRVAHLAVLDV